MSKENKDVKYAKLSITIPEDLATEIRESTDNVSAFISQAAQEYLSRQRFIRAVRRAKGAWTDQDYPDLNSAEDILAWLEKLRKGPDRIEGQD